MLEDGRVLRNQVTYDSLEPSDWGVLGNSSQTDDGGGEDHNATKEQARADAIAESLPQEGELLRQTGDTECYKIFLRSMGWGFVLVMLALLVVQTGLETMPRK